jgi:hypothetical protein
MQNDEVASGAFSILTSAFCLLHSFETRQSGYFADTRLVNNFSAPTTPAGNCLNQANDV